MLSLLLPFTEIDADSGGLYTWIPPSPDNLTSTTSSAVFLLNVTITAEGPREDAAAIVNNTAAMPMDWRDVIGADASADYEPVVSEIRNTFAPLLTIWFRTSKRRYRTAILTLTCNDTYSAVLMTSPRTQLAFVVFLREDRGQTLHIHSFSTRQCMRRAEELMTGEMAGKLRRLLSHTCHALRLSPEEQRERARKIKTIFGKTVFQEAYNFTNVLIVFLLFMLCAVLISFSALLWPNLCQDGCISPKRIRTVWDRGFRVAPYDKKTFISPDDV